MEKISTSTITNTTSAIKQEKKKTIKDNKILSHFRKTNSIVNSSVSGNGVKNLTTTAGARVVRRIDKRYRPSGTNVIYRVLSIRIC